MLLVQCRIQEYCTSSKDNTERQVIRQVSVKPFYAICFTEGGVKAFHSLSPMQTIHINASGSILKSLLISKRLLYYELTLESPVPGCSPLPIAVMISSDHSLPTITNFLNVLRFHEGK